MPGVASSISTIFSKISSVMTVTRAHVIAWRDELKKSLTGPSVRHRLPALASLFEYLCEKNAVSHNPVRASSGQN
jgi:site-specific recombinase XerD